METTVREPAQRIPVALRVDVAVAGAGVSGIFAALGAARQGMRVALIDRFGAVGGNLGPGYIVGCPVGATVDTTFEIHWAVPDGRLTALPREFLDRVGRRLHGYPINYPTLSHAVSREVLDMLAEAGVTLMLSAYVADPIMRGQQVCGLFVETAAGRQAVLAKVVVDATGDAAVAARAGAPVVKGSTAAECDSPNLWPICRDPKLPSYNESGLFVVMANADIARYQRFCRSRSRWSDRDRQWAARHNQSWPPAVVPILRRAWDSGEFRWRREVRPGLRVQFENWFTPIGPGISGGRVQLHGDFDTADWRDVTLLETALRSHAVDGVDFFRRHVSGFDGAYIVTMSPFAGARGGPHIRGEFTLTPQASFTGFTHPDVLFHTVCEVHRGAAAGHDVPYGILLPRGVENLLVAGRGTSYLRRGHDPSFRARCNMMLLGQAAGVAAALSAQKRVTPRRLNVRLIQRALHALGFPLGTPDRLRDLGLARTPRCRR